MHARLDVGRVQILTRRGNDWTDKYPAIARSVAGLPAQNAYLDGELCGVLPDGRTAFNLIQNATDTGEGSLVFFLFDLLHLDGENLMALPLVDRKTRTRRSPDRARPGLSSVGVRTRRRGHRVQSPRLSGRRRIRKRSFAGDYLGT
jgi:bifunctional non-homologous end joining protein LigD